MAVQTDSAEWQRGPRLTCHEENCDCVKADAERVAALASYKSGLYSRYGMMCSYGITLSYVS
jgi:hypothetical protein